MKLRWHNWMALNCPIRQSTYWLQLVAGHNVQIFEDRLVCLFWNIIGIWKCDCFSFMSIVGDCCKKHKFKITKGKKRAWRLYKIDMVCSNPYIYTSYKSKVLHMLSMPLCGYWASGMHFISFFFLKFGLSFFFFNICSNK